MTAKLEIINQMLAATGTSPLTSKDTKHPAYLKAASKVDIVSAAMQARGWWFNRRTALMHPNTAGEIILPANALHADPVDTSQNFVIRGRRLFDMTAGTFNIAAPVKVALVEQVAIEDLPFTAQDYIRAKAVHDYYRDIGGTGASTAEFREDRDRTLAALKAEDLKNADPNVFPGMQAALAAPVSFTPLHRRGIRSRAMR